MKKLFAAFMLILLMASPAFAIDTDGTLSANSDTRIPSQKATKTYVDGHTSAPAGSDKQIQYNNNGTLAGTSVIQFNSGTGAASITAGSFTNATTLSMASGSQGIISTPKYIPGYWYVGLIPGNSTTTTNTTPLVDGTEYATAAIAATPINIKAIKIRTSSSAAQIGASLKVCVYGSDGTNGAPGTLLGSTATGVAVTDATANLYVSFTLDSVAAVPAGVFWVAILQTSTTGVRTVIPAGSVQQSMYFGTAAGTGMAGTSPIYGYTVAQAYASGCASPFGTAVINSTQGLAPAFEYQIN